MEALNRFEERYFTSKKDISSLRFSLEQGFNEVSSISLEEKGKKIIFTNNEIISILEGIEFSDFEEFENFKKGLIGLIEKFIKRGYIGHLSEKGLGLIRFLAQVLMGGKDMRELEIRVGLGISDKKGVSARNPAYIAYTIELFKDLEDYYIQNGIVLNNGLFPSVKVYSAANMVIQTNNLGSEALKNRETIFKYMRNFVNFLPEYLRLNFVFLNDKECFSKENKEVIEFLGRKSEENMSQSSYNKMKKISERTGASVQDCINYSASHSLYSGDDIGFKYESILEGEDGISENILMIGGESEIEYWRIRESLNNAINGQTKPQFIMKGFKIPPYSGGLIQKDLSDQNIGDFENDSEIKEKLRGDFWKDICRIIAKDGEKIKMIKEILS